MKPTLEMFAKACSASRKDVGETGSRPTPDICDIKTKLVNVLQTSGLGVDTPGLEAAILKDSGHSSEVKFMKGGDNMGDMWRDSH